MPTAYIIFRFITALAQRKCSSLAKEVFTGLNFKDKHPGKKYLYTGKWVPNTHLLIHVLIQNNT